MRRASTAISVIALAIFILAGCSSPVRPSPTPDVASNEVSSEPRRLKVGDRPFVVDQPASVPANPAQTGDAKQLGGAAQQQLEMFLAAWSLVEQEFYDRDAIDYRKMARGAIKGMLESLGDEGTTFSDASRTRMAEEDMRGSFDGIGVTVEMKDKRLTVVSPLDDSPGAQAGLRAGDVIVRIDARDTADLSLPEAVSLIRGPRGTVVRLSVEREGEPKPLVFEIVRREINVVPVKAQMMDGKVAYVKITQFSEPAPKMFRQKLTELLADKPRAVILDLRNNPGGLLGPAVEVVSQFIGDGAVMYGQHRNAPAEAIEAQPGGLATNLPVIALINKGTASAAEIVAGALQDRGRGVLVGERSFGKDTVQNVHRLDDGSAISITVARWYTPKKQDIAGRGLAPDVEVPLTDEDVKAGQDPQLERALARARGAN